MFLSTLATFIGTIRTELMVEIERNPLVLRQGAAALACVAAAAVAMPVIAERAAEQRALASADFAQVDYARRLEARLVSHGDEAVEMALAALRDGQGLAAEGSAAAPGLGQDRAALVLQASLRGRAPAPFQARAGYERELRCLSEGVYYEARGESRLGQIAVAEVILNRVASPHYPNTICGVVYQGSHRATGCQFTFTCDGSVNKSPRGRPWRQAREVAAEVMAGDYVPVTGRATHYHTDEVRPRWAPRLVETNRIGAHIFYRYPTASERAAMPSWANAGRRSAPSSTDAAEEATQPDTMEAPQVLLVSEGAVAALPAAPTVADAVASPQPEAETAASAAATPVAPVATN